MCRACIFRVDIQIGMRVILNRWQPLARIERVPSLAVFYLLLMELRNVRDKLPPRKTLSLYCKLFILYTGHRNVF